MSMFEVVLAWALAPAVFIGGGRAAGGPCSPPALKGYETRLSLDGPILAGPARAITGRGAPAGDGIWVELWRIPAGGGRTESLGSVAAQKDLLFAHRIVSHYGVKGIKEELARKFGTSTVCR